MNALKKVSTVIFYGEFAVIALAVMFVVLTRIGGIQSYVIESGSMEPNIPVGSLVFVENNIQGENIASNDVIAFEVSSGSNKICTHRALSNDIDSQSIQTKGDANDAIDATPVTYDRIVGRMVMSIPQLGWLMEAFSRNRMLVVVVCIAVILCTYLLSTVTSRKTLSAPVQKERTHEFNQHARPAVEIKQAEIGNRRYCSYSNGGDRRVNRIPYRFRYYPK